MNTPTFAGISDESMKPAKITKAERIIDMGTKIGGAAPEGDEIAYWHSTLCQVGLPRSKIIETEFERRWGDSTLRIEAGTLYDGEHFVQQPIPYGPMPRLLLAWMNQYAKRFRTTEIPCGDSANEWMRLIGKVPNGGRNSVHTTFRRQLNALAACHMALGFRGTGTALTQTWKPIQKFEAWLPSSNHKSCWPKTIFFSDDYMQTLRDHAVPIDFRAYQELSYSALAMDVYSWLAQRLYFVEVGHPVLIRWPNLHTQFGQEYTGENGPGNFRRNFLRVLAPVKTVYPAARIDQTPEGLVLKASQPPVPPR